MLNLKGYAEARKAGKIIPIDTRDMCRALDPEVRRMSWDQHPATLENWARGSGLVGSLDKAHGHLDGHGAERIALNRRIGDLALYLLGCRYLLLLHHSDRILDERLVNGTGSLALGTQFFGQRFGLFGNLLGLSFLAFLAAAFPC